MTCAEFKELCASLALDALDADERAAAEAHLAESIAHDGCAEALARARATADALGRSVAPVAPSPKLWPSLEGQLAVRRRRGVPAWTGWAAAAVAAAAAAWIYVQDHETAETEHAIYRYGLAAAKNDLAGCRRDLDVRDTAVAMLSRPDTRIVPFVPQAGATTRATAILDPVRNRGIVVAAQLEVDAQHDYELWIIRGDSKLPAGLLRSPKGGPFATELDPQNLAGADALAVTLEPAGGGDTPRGQLVLVATLK